MPQDFPGANYNAPVGNDDLKFEASVYKAEFLERLRLVFGNPSYIAASSWGIVTDSDPTTVTTGQSPPAPLMVEASDLTVNVTPGIAVTKSGHRIVVNASVNGVQMASTEADAINVIAASYVLTTPDEESTTEYHQTAFRTRLVAPNASLIAVYTLPQWNALLPDTTDDMVPLAIVQITKDGFGTKALVVTHSSASYTWLRPWFSPVDVMHRAMIGSGTISETNPHALAFNDLSIGNFTLPMVVRRCGAVIAKENSVAACPGTLCVTTIQTSQVLWDEEGYITGVLRTAYVVLPFYPIALGSVFDISGSRPVELAFEILPGTQIIYQLESAFKADPNISILQVYATRATAIEPPNSLVTQANFTAGNLSSTEAVVASGKVYVNTSSMTLTDGMSDASYIPIDYRFYLADGNVVKNPQVLLCRTLLSTFGTGIAPSITQLGPGVALIALENAVSGPSLSVKVRITGTDITGAAVTEILTFDSTWVGSTPPSSVTQYNQFKRGSVAWASITSVSLDEYLNAGDLAAIQLWIIMDPTTAPALSYACPIADTHWDGTKLSKIQDLRPIVSELAYGPDIDVGITALHYCATPPNETGYTRGENVYAEDFRRMQRSSLVTPDPNTSWYGFGLGIEVIYGRERSLDSMTGLYESRAMALKTIPAESFVTVFLYPASTNNLSFSGLIEQPLFWWAVQDATSGIWASWSSVFSVSTSVNTYSLTLPANVCALRFRLMAYKRGARGWSLVQKYS